jgi:hypothetical protein
MVFVALPSSIASEMEEWYVGQVKEMTKRRSEKDGSLPRSFGEQPSEKDLETLDEFLQENGKKSGVHLMIQKPRARDAGRPMKQQELNWFVPFVMNHIIKSSSEWEAQTALGGYAVCFDNTSAEEEVFIVFDVLLVSDEIEDDDDDEQQDAKIDLKTKHLTPLEEQLKVSIGSAKAILNEMDYMEKREARMRRTADSINRNVRWFSYLSITILLSVSFLQVRYLKRYFRKKKIM